MNRVHGDYNNREHKLNNLELASQDSRPLIAPPMRPLSSFTQVITSNFDILVTLTHTYNALVFLEST